MKRRMWLLLLAAAASVFVLGNLALFWIGYAQVEAWSQRQYRPPTPTPDLPLEAIAQQFEWRFRYPGSRRLQGEGPLADDFAAEAEADRWQADDVRLVNELHVWKGAKVRLHLKTRDVLHSFFVPNLRLKQDAVPGKVVPVWFAAQESNYQWDETKKTWVETELWELACAELCGWGHFKMRGKLHVHATRMDYLAWLEQVERLQRDSPDGE